MNYDDASVVDCMIRMEWACKQALKKCGGELVSSGLEVVPYDLANTLGDRAFYHGDYWQDAYDQKLFLKMFFMCLFEIDGKIGMWRTDMLGITRARDKHLVNEAIQAVGGFVDGSK